MLPEVSLRCGCMQALPGKKRLGMLLEREGGVVYKPTYVETQDVLMKVAK